MKRKYTQIFNLVYILILITIPIYLSAQQLVWENIFDNGDQNISRCLTTDKNGNIIVSGYNIHTLHYGLTVKYNESGDTIWTRRSETPISSVACDDFGNIIAGGTIFSNDSLRIKLIKYDPSGNIVWSQISKGFYLFQSRIFLTVDSQNNIFVCATYDSQYGVDYDILTIKYNSNAEFQWARIFDAHWQDYPIDITTDNLDNVIITASTQKVHYDVDWCLIKYNNLGDTLWTTSLDIGDEDYPSCIDTDKDGNIYVCGGAGSSWEVYEYRVNKYNPTGTLIWSNIFKDTLGFKSGSIRDIKVDTCDNIFISGIYGYRDTMDLNWYEYYLAKLDQDMNYLWTFTHCVDGNMENHLEDMDLDYNGNLILTGTTKKYKNSGAESYYTIKVSDILSGVLDPFIAFTLNQNYPNPFNPTTAICYQLSAVSDVELVIYDLSGQKIKQWSYQNQTAGTYEITWNGKDQNGNSVPSGVYIYRMVAGEFAQSRKMVVLK